MEIAEFLLARFAEDEAVARELLARDYAEKFRHRGSAAETWHNSDHREEGVSLSPERVLAKYRADRLIVENALLDVRDARRRPGWTIPDSEVDEKGRDYRVGYENAKAKLLPEALDRTERLLRLLALPYADHPDYSPEWKV